MSKMFGNINLSTRLSGILAFKVPPPLCLNMYDSLRETSSRLFNELNGVVSCWTSTDREEGRIGLEMFFVLTVRHRWKVLIEDQQSAGFEKLLGRQADRWCNAHKQPHHWLVAPCHSRRVLVSQNSFLQPVCIP